MRFKVGDRIKAIQEYEGNDEIVEKYGIIKGIQNSGRGTPIYIIYFDKNICGHDEAGGEYGHSWNIPAYCLELETPVEVKIYGIAKFCKEMYK